MSALVVIGKKGEPYLAIYLRSNSSILRSSPLIIPTHLFLRDMFKGIGLFILLGPPIVSATVVIGKKR